METLTDKPSPIILGKRYVLNELLGTGGMGTVFLAKDLLTGNQVALKQVAVPTAQIMFAGRKDHYGFNLSLAQEFRTLASVRHPHIISVYDFGFGLEGQPYYTMEYLGGALPILEASKKLSVQGNADLIIQMLQALVYLHRRGILHRDLKPTNALVVGGRLKLLDFGLSVITERTVEHLTQTTSGTVAYLAPEIFQGAAYSRASDLYAVGLIAFQLFSGHFPYDESNLATMLFEIVSKPVDASAYGIDGRLATVLNKLLAKTRETRYADAGEAIVDMAAAVNMPLPPETVEIRESFLQAAKFVGREKELADLSDKLEAAISGQGAVVMIGGESGVGKSRLMDELRIRALVGGVLVLQGQAISNGRIPYQLWLDVLRSLSLFGDLGEEEATALKPLVPELERLLGREVPDGPAATPQESPKRLTRTISRLLGRLDQPVLILLEDLQWAGSESLQLLNDLTPGVADQSVLLVGTFRDDEPMLKPDMLAQATFLSIQRLTNEDITELSVSMLGRAGQDPELVTLLQRETEGNAFFLVEAVRTLAEEAGHLDRVPDMALPETIVTGGIRTILNRRLERVPDNARPLLQLASVAGRRLDMALLQALRPEIDLESWLAVVSAVAIIEAQGESWRFAHDKLREEIKESLSHEDHQALHRRVAEALETIYPDDAEHAAALAHHWAVAGEVEKELHYAELAGKQAVATGAIVEARVFLERALELLKAKPESAERDQKELSLLMELGPHLIIMLGYGAPEVERTYLRSQELAAQTGNTDSLFRSIAQWIFYDQVSAFETATGLIKQLFRLAEQSGDESLLLEACHSGWSSALARGDLTEALKYVRQGLAIYDPEKHRDHMELYGHDPGVCGLRTGSLSLWLMGYPDAASTMAADCQVLAAKMGGHFQKVLAGLAVGQLALVKGEYEKALEIGNDLMTFLEETGSKMGEDMVQTIQGAALTGQGEVSKGITKARNALFATTLVGVSAARPYGLASFLEACLAAGEVDEGIAAIRAELAGHEVTGQRVFESEIRRLHGELLLAKDDKNSEEAEKEFSLAVEIARQQKARSLELRAVMSLVRLWERQGKAKQARAKLAECYGWFTEGFDTADLVAARKLLAELQ